MKSVVAPAEMALAVSTVIFSLRPSSHSSGDALWIPLVRRTRGPFEGQWALPGGWVGGSESLEAAAGRTLRETTGLRSQYLEQLYTFGRPDRSAEADDGRVISVVYSALLRLGESSSDESGDNVGWFEVDRLPDLAFDHNEIVEYALWRLRTKIEYANVAFFFLGETFSLRELREVYEAILQRPLDPANFRRRVEATGAIVATTDKVHGGRHRPPLLYRCAEPAVPQVKGPAA